MRIGLLAYGLDRPLTGISRYTVELARALANLPDRPQVTLLAAGGCASLAAETGFPVYRLPGCRLLPGLMTLGNLLLPWAAHRLRLDVLHDPTGVTPLMLGAGGAAVVVTVHDVFAWSVPGYSSTLDDWIYHAWLPRLLPRRAKLVITDSWHSGKEITRYLRVPEERIKVIYPAQGAYFKPVELDQARQSLVSRYSINNPFILYVGALTRRKNIESALRAFALLSSSYSDLQFVVVGPSSWQGSPIARLVSELGLGERVKLAGVVPDEDLPFFYCAAQLFIFPSLYEGFGFPPLEAMACGTPVVCSNVSSLPEVVGDAALLAAPTDVFALAEAMRQILALPELAQELRQRGLRQAARFSYQRTATETRQVYEQACAAQRMRLGH